MSSIKVTILLVLAVVIVFLSTCAKAESLDNMFNYDDADVLMRKQDDPLATVARSQSQYTSSEEPSNNRVAGIVLGIIGGIAALAIILAVIGAVVFLYYRNKGTYQEI
jgi:cytochrome oxidase Cu insertion factor (SCO1/SenC/PrrC family)